jgi:hypothetical protein
VRVTTDRRGYAGGSVVHAAGPWRTSGEWWEAGKAGRAGESGRTGEAGKGDTEPSCFSDLPVQPHPPYLPFQPYWNRDEWDVSLSDGGVYRIFRDRETDGWFIEGIFD